MQPLAYVHPIRGNRLTLVPRAWDSGLWEVHNDDHAWLGAADYLPNLQNVMARQGYRRELPEPESAPAGHARYGLDVDHATDADCQREGMGAHWDPYHRVHKDIIIARPDELAEIAAIYGADEHDYSCEGRGFESGMNWYKGRKPGGIRVRVYLLQLDPITPAPEPQPEEEEFIPVTRYVCDWRGYAGELRWRDGYAAELLAAHIEILTEDLPSETLMTLDLFPPDVALLRSVGAFPHVEPQREEEAPEPARAPFEVQYPDPPATDDLTAYAESRAAAIGAVEIEHGSVTVRLWETPNGRHQIRASLEYSDYARRVARVYLVEERYDGRTCRVVRATRPDDTPEPLQAVTPAGTAYLLPGFEPAPRRKGGAIQGSLF